MNCPRLWNLLEIAVMDIGSRTTIHAKKEGLQKIYKQCQRELGFEKVAQDKDIEIADLQDKLSRRNMQIKQLKKDYNRLLNACSTDELRQKLNIKI